MIEWWLGKHSSSMRSGLCVELWSGHGESKNQSVVSVQNACFNVEAVIEIEGFKVGPKRSHVALRNLRIERSKSRSSSSSSNSSEPSLPVDFELALVFDKPGQYTLPISDITRIRCKYLQQGKASIEAKGSLVLLTAVTQGDLERLLLFIRDVKTGKTPVESRSCVVCREKGHKVKHKREELQSTENSQTSKQDGDCQATKKQKTEVLDCIFRKRQLLHVSPGQDQVLKQLKDLKNRDHVHKSKKMGSSPRGSEDRPYVLDSEVCEPSSKIEVRFQDTMRQNGRENSGSRRSPPASCSRSKDGQESRSSSPTFTRVQFDERSRKLPEDVRRERPGTWSGTEKERETLSPEGGKENFKGEDEVRKIGEETVRRLAEERRRTEEEKRRILEEQRRRAEEEHRRVQEEHRKKYEEERRRREELRTLEEEERRQAEERERKSQDERRRREEKERQKEELRKLVEDQERKRKEEKERRAAEEERRRIEEEERLLQELRRQKLEEERLRKELERRVQEQEQLRMQEEERRRKEEEDQRLLELRRQKEEVERVKREQERRLQEQVLEIKRRQEEEKKKQEALRRQRLEEERLLQERRKQEELRRQKYDEQSKRSSEEERRPRQDSAGLKAQEDLKMRMLMEEERKKQEENQRRALEEQREKLEQRRLDEEMRQWQREEDQRRAKEDKWNMSDEERTRLEEQRHCVEEVMKMTRDLARKRLEETVKEEERKRQAQNDKDEAFCRKFLDEDKRTLDEDIQKLVDKASNVASLEEVLIKLRERCSFRSERVASDNVENEPPASDRGKGMSYLFTRLEEKKKALKEEQGRIRKEEARLNAENSADFHAKAEKRRQEELKRLEIERKRAEKAASAVKKKLQQDQLRAAKVEGRRLERARKEAEKRAKAEERAKQQQKAHEQARKQAQEQAKQQRYPPAPQRWPSYNHRPLTYQQYEESWNVMKLSRTSSTLGYADIPWPPAGNPLFIESGDSLEVQRRKLRVALLRWHPDKFMALCKDRLGSTDRESIETQAKHLAQQVIQWKSRLEQA